MIKPIIGLLLAGSAKPHRVAINSENQCTDLAYAEWMKGFYYAETENDEKGNYVRKGRESVPKK